MNHRVVSSQNNSDAKISRRIFLKCTRTIIFMPAGFFQRKWCGWFLALILVVQLPAGPPAASKDFSPKVADFTPPGWQIYERAKQFTPQNLYEQINGRVSLFLAYDVRQLTFVSFVQDVDIARFVNLSIYDMGEPTNAFGIFSIERDPEASTLNLGRAAYRSGANYFVWQGQYYIQVIASDDTTEMQHIGLVLARKAADSLPDAGEPVWGLTALPPTDRVPLSVQYYKVNAMGLDFMHNTYTAIYNKGNARVTAFLSRQQSAESARSVMLQYAGYANRYGKGCDRLKGGEVELVSCDMDGSFDVVYTKGRLVGGVASVADRRLAVKAAIEMREQLPTGQ